MSRAQLNTVSVLFGLEWDGGYIGKVSDPDCVSAKLKHCTVRPKARGPGWIRRLSNLV